jgi:hypothetical protein
MTILLAIECTDGLAMFVDSGGTTAPSGLAGSTHTFEQDHDKLWQFTFGQQFVVLVSGELTFADAGRTRVSGFRGVFEANHLHEEFHSNETFAETFSAEFKEYWNRIAQPEVQICGVVLWFGSNINSEGPVVRSASFLNSHGKSPLSFEKTHVVEMHVIRHAQYSFPKEAVDLASSLLTFGLKKSKPVPLRKSDYELFGCLRESHTAFTTLASKVSNNRMTLETAMSFGNFLVNFLISYYECTQPTSRPTGHRLAGGKCLSATL